MSYTELEHGYQGLRQATQPQFYVGDDGNLVPIRSPVSTNTKKLLIDLIPVLH